MTSSANNTWVVPLDARRREAVVGTTHQRIAFAEHVLCRELAAIPVLFDLKGRSAGMYRVKHGERVIRYNPYLFAKYYEDSLNNTVIHEVAHYVVDVLHGLPSVRPHGTQWQTAMAMFGAKPNRTCHYDMSGIPVRTQRRFSYGCGCMTHELSTFRHNKIQYGTARYSCRRCGEVLIAFDAQQGAG